MPPSHSPGISVIRRKTLVHTPERKWASKSELDQWCFHATLFNNQLSSFVTLTFIANVVLIDTWITIIEEGSLYGFSTDGTTIMATFDPCCFFDQAQNL